MTSARALYSEPKSKLCERTAQNLLTLGGVAEGIGRGGNAREVSELLFTRCQGDCHVAKSNK
jgi:hypothetical protein